MRTKNKLRLVEEELKKYKKLLSEEKYAREMAEEEYQEALEDFYTASLLTRIKWLFKGVSTENDTHGYYSYKIFCETQSAKTS